MQLFKKIFFVVVVVVVVGYCVSIGEKNGFFRDGSEKFYSFFGSAI
jgi:hypothetical protein